MIGPHLLPTLQVDRTLRLNPVSYQGICWSWVQLTLKRQEQRRTSHHFKTWSCNRKAGHLSLPTLRSNLHNSRPLTLWKSWKWRVCPSQSVNRRSERGTSHLPILLAVVMNSSVLQSVRGWLWACRESTAQQRRSHLPVSLPTTSVIRNTLKTVTKHDPGSREWQSSGLQPSPKTCCRRAVPEMRASYFTLRCSVSFPKPLPLLAWEAWINKVARRPIWAMWRGVTNSSKHCIKWQPPMFPRRLLAIPVCKAEFLRECLSSAYHVLSKGMNKADKTLVLCNLCCAERNKHLPNMESKRCGRADYTEQVTGRWGRRGPRHLLQTKAEGRWSDRRICMGKKEVRKTTGVRSWRRMKQGDPLVQLRADCRKQRRGPVRRHREH